MLNMDRLKTYWIWAQSNAQTWTAVDFTYRHTYICESGALMSMQLVVNFNYFTTLIYSQSNEKKSSNKKEKPTLSCFMNRYTNEFAAYD